MAVDIALYFTALGAGIISFISPCNLVLLPAFLSYVASTARNRKESFMLSILYTIGFAITFAVLGVVFLAGIMNLQNRRIFNLLAGIITILLALYLFFNKEIQIIIHKFQQRKAPTLPDVDPRPKEDLLITEDLPPTENPLPMEDSLPLKSINSLTSPKIELEEKTTAQKYTGFTGAFILGFSTGSSWIACVTPVFGTILAIGSVQQNYSAALYLMIIYGVGIMVPFIIIGTLIGELNARILMKMIKLGSKLERVFALILVWIGIEIILSGFNIAGILEFI